MKLKLIVSIFCMLWLSVPLLAQRTVTNRLCVSCIPYEQYQLNAQGNKHGFYKAWNRQGKLIIHSNYKNGDLHGSYIKYFDNGMSEKESTYTDGELRSSIDYAYINGKRYMISKYVYDNNGNLIYSGHRPYNEYSLDNTVYEFKQTIGKLANGKGTWHIIKVIKQKGTWTTPDIYYPNDAYGEKYWNNDTTYIWTDKTKTTFMHKEVHYRNVDDIIEERNKQIQDSLARIEHDRQDSIRLAEENRLRIERHEKRERERLAEIANKERLQREQEENIKLIIKTDSLYTSLLNNNEYKLYNFMAKYLKKTKNYDEQLKTMIVTVLGLRDGINFAKLYIQVKPRQTMSMSNAYAYDNNYAYANITITSKNYGGTGIYFESYRDANHYQNITGVTGTMKAKQAKQQQLIDIILYCQANDISIK